MMFGIEFALKNLNLIYEIQIIKISVPDRPRPQRYFMMFGVRF